ncbi:hypothetical protein [Flavobacterium humidisoli]|uniref:Chain length determinant protein n=1 Tax=Flavobacterium humidisoli TaxID=2937442 RepID=A0ABY4LW03_9FLAO|nr:hypothetical protein [Flavobacterium humidisoli]UPZ16758.1 hypothetical protein M0M44_05300 [Flavobacterium humidisoli]
MSTKVPQNAEDQEIDLVLISKKFSNFFARISTSIFKGIQFFIKNWVFVLILIVVGFVVGIVLDRTQKIYDSQLIVTPNFGSVDYLYAKIELLKSKINEQDTLFLRKEVGFKDPLILSKIEIKPIADVYRFIENKENNLELIKLMSENSDVNKIIEDNTTSKNYTYHKILFTTSGFIDDDNTIQPLLNYLNKSEYYKKIQIVALKNIQEKIAQNDTILNQINVLLNSFSKSANKSNSTVYYNENFQIDEVLKTKQKLIADQGYNRLEIINSDKIIKENSQVLNVLDTKKINGKLKLILPFLFLFLFISFRFVLIFYKKQSKKQL